MISSSPQDRTRVLMAGPLPPSIGGMVTVIGDMTRSSLAAQVELVLFDTKKQTPAGRSLVQAIRARLDVWQRWWRLLTPTSRTIAHIHTCSGLTYFLDGALALLAQQRGVPVILHVHGATFDQFLDGLAPPLRAVARWLARRAARVVVLSEEWREKLNTRLPGARLSIIPNGVAPPPTDVVVDATPGITALFLGNLGTRKGVWDLIACMTQVNSEVRLVLVGGEEEPGALDKARTEVMQLGLNERVIVAGPTFGADKYSWLCSADIFVLPSYAEGLPISMLEAMATGLPMIVTPVGGIPSVITHDVDGLLVPPGDCAALVAAINRLAQDATLRQRLGTAARARCDAGYGIERSAAAYLALYRELQAAAGDRPH